MLSSSQRQCHVRELGLLFLIPLLSNPRAAENQASLVWSGDMRTPEIGKVSCMRDSFLYGIGSGFPAGFLAFLHTSKWPQPRHGCVAASRFKRVTQLLPYAKGLPVATHQPHLTCSKYCGLHAHPWLAQQRRREQQNFILAISRFYFDFTYENVVLCFCSFCVLAHTFRPLLIVFTTARRVHTLETTARFVRTVHHTNMPPRFFVLRSLCRNCDQGLPSCSGFLRDCGAWHMVSYVLLYHTSHPRYPHDPPPLTTSARLHDAALILSTVCCGCVRSHGTPSCRLVGCCSRIEQSAACD
jgi:hypothetical protein